MKHSCEGLWGGRGRAGRSLGSHRGKGEDLSCLFPQGHHLLDSRQSQQSPGGLRALDPAPARGCGSLAEGWSTYCHQPVLLKPLGGRDGPPS